MQPAGALTTTKIAELPRPATLPEQSNVDVLVCVHVGPLTKWALAASALVAPRAKTATVRRSIRRMKHLPFK
jgi:hypothetical protein